MAAMNIKGLSVPDLLSMRSNIDKLLQSRKAELHAQLAEIGGGGTSSSTTSDGGGRGSRSKGRKVAAKYRNPKTGDTWSGRGGVASWLAQEIKSGKKREDFLIDKSSADGAAKTGRGRPAKAGRKAK